MTIVAERLAQVNAKTQSDTVTDVKAEERVDILAYKQVEVRPKTLTDRRADVKAGTLDEMRH